MSTISIFPHELLCTCTDLFFAVWKGFDVPFKIVIPENILASKSTCCDEVCRSPSITACTRTSVNSIVKLRTFSVTQSPSFLMIVGLSAAVLGETSSSQSAFRTPPQILMTGCHNCSCLFPRASHPYLGNASSFADSSAQFDRD